MGFLTINPPSGKQLFPYGPFVEEKKPIAYCRDCDLLFRFEEREVFNGENFCPRCAGRAPHHYRTLTEGRKEHRSAETLKD
jgi:uncharacterized paraquat-inducible protein A